MFKDYDAHNDNLFQKKKSAQSAQSARKKQTQIKKKSV